MNKFFMLLAIATLAGCSASIGVPPSRTTTYTTAPTVSHTTYSTPVASTTTTVSQ